MTKELGWKKPLYILPFDHRNTFFKELFSSSGLLNNNQIEIIKHAKQLIYDAFLMCIESGVPKEYAAILVDEQYGNEIILNAKSRGITVCINVERSGQHELDFEYGNEFTEHIKKYSPTFCKVLVRYNPDSDKELNKRQLQKLAIISYFCKENGYKYLVEVLIPPTDKQIEEFKKDYFKFDTTMRPKLTVKTIQEMQNNNVEPDVWKIEGLFNKQDYVHAVKQAREGSREQVGIIILGKGDSKEHVEKWISEGAQVEGVIGFAVGRTVFLEPIKEYIKEIINKEKCIEKIHDNFMYYYKLFESSKKSVRN